MRTNHVKAKLAKGEVSLGAWLAIPNVTIARMMARMGFDWLVVDAEHGPQTPDLMSAMVATIADSGICAPIVRVPQASVEWFKWSLDAGAWGIVVPMVNTPEEAARAVDWSKYPPAGNRSLGGAFAGYGFGTTDRNRYFQEINDQMLVIAQIESAQALQNLDAILSVPGVDVAFVGPNDLHAQLGLPPSIDGAEPEFVAALDRIKAAARRHNVATGMFSSGGESAARRAKEGFQMISVTADVICLPAAVTRELKRASEPS